MEFKHKLPAMKADGRDCGNYNNPEIGYPCLLSTLNHELGDFIATLRKIVRDERRLVFIDNKVLVAYLNWIRDHVHMMKAFNHFEYDLKSFMDFILDNQRDSGYFFELIKQMDDPHWQFVNPDCYKLYQSDNLAAVRLEIEADIEYLMVEGAVAVYRATGDNEWIKKTLPKLEKGIEYMMNDPKRWDNERGLVKRAFTIDTWDFVYNKPGSNRKIEEDTPMSIMHGDNSGVYAACVSLSWLNKRFGFDEKASYWSEKAGNLMESLNKYLWNGKFFIHQLHLNHEGADNLERERLSLSNTYDINRGATNLSQADSIISEYIKRREQNNHFAEWYSIDPPYERFNGLGVNKYVNGCICLFTAGELAKASFNNGYEEYGWDILCRLMKLAKKDGTLYFLYSSETQDPQSGGPSGWGAAAIHSAIDEGLAGIIDTDVLYNKISFSPKWVVTPYTDLRYVTGYEISKRHIDIRYMMNDKGMLYEIKSPSKQINCHILIPKDTSVKEVYVDGNMVTFCKSIIRNSVYLDFTVVNSEDISVNRIECIFE